MDLIVTTVGWQVQYPESKDKQLLFDVVGQGQWKDSEKGTAWSKWQAVRMIFAAVLWGGRGGGLGQMPGGSNNQGCPGSPLLYLISRQSLPGIQMYVPSYCWQLTDLYLSTLDPSPPSKLQSKPVSLTSPWGELSSQAQYGWNIALIPPPRNPTPPSPSPFFYLLSQWQGAPLTCHSLRSITWA